MTSRSLLGLPAFALLLASATGVSSTAAAQATGMKVRATYNHGRLTVVGTNAADRIRVVRKLNSVIVKVNGHRIDVGKPIRPAALKRVKLRGLRGDDQLILVEKAGPLPSARLQGGEGNDLLRGGSGNTLMYGKSGNDVIQAGPGSSTMTGDAGDDQLTGGAGATRMTAGVGNDVLTAGSGDTSMDAGDGNDRLTGGSGQTSMSGGFGTDQLTGGSGPTTMRGNGDNDVMTGGMGVTMMIGGGGDDTMSGGAGRVTMEGGSGGDVMTGGSGVSDMKGEEGGDLLTGGSGPSTMAGGTANDVLVGGPNVNTLIGDDGADQLIGGPLSDKVSGAAGTDLLIQSPGGDQLVGGDGDDLYRLDADAPGGAISLIENVSDGVDSIDLASSSLDVVLDLSDGGVQVLSPSLSVKLAETDSFDSVTAGLGHDQVRGNRLDNVVIGGLQDDSIEGRGGNDTLTGGPGPDAFAFRKAGATELLGNDTVTDFGLGLDTVDLTGLSVKSGLGTAAVVVWDGVTDFGSIISTNGHLWVLGDFS